MVKVGFIVEGACEKIVIESAVFKDFLQRNDFELIEPVVDANGAGNLLPHNIEPFIGVLEANGAERLYILTDSDGLPVESVKERINHAKITAYFIAVKAIEAWFLADTQAMKKFLEIENCKPPPTFALCCSNFCTLGSAKVSTAFALYRMMRNKKSDATVAFYFTNYIRPILHWFYQFYFFRPYKPIQVE